MKVTATGVGGMLNQCSVQAGGIFLYCALCRHKRMEREELCTGQTERNILGTGETTKRKARLFSIYSTERP